MERHEHCEDHGVRTESPRTFAVFQLPQLD
jgi:hypothetical protein